MKRILFLLLIICASFQNFAQSSYPLNPNSGGSGQQISQQLNATGAISAWGVTLDYGTTAPTSNGVLTIPPCSNNDIGKRITIIRSDATAFTLSTIATGADIGTITTPAILNAQNGSLTLECTSATTYKQISNIGQVVMAEYVEVKLNATTSTNLTVADHIKYDILLRQIGTSITPDISTTYTNTSNVNSLGRFLLQPNKVYELEGDCGDITGAASSYINYRWFNADTGTEIATGTGGASIVGANLTSTNASRSMAITTFAPTVATRVELRIQTISGITNYGGNFASNNATARIRVISGFTPVTGQSVDYLYAKGVSNQTGISNTITPLNFTNTVSGNIPLASNAFTLTVGKTYRITANLALNGSSVSGDIFNSSIVDNTNTPVSGLVTPILTLSDAIANRGSQPVIDAIFTPTVTGVYKIALQRTSGTGTVNIDMNASSLSVIQLGSSAITTTTRVNLICRNKTLQSIPSATWTALTNWNVVQDPTSSFVSSTGIFTAPRAMTVIVTGGNAVFTTLIGQYVGCSIWKTGSQLYNTLFFAAASGANYISTNGAIEMLAGDTLQLRSYSGGATANDTPSASNSWFTITEINPTF